MTDNEIVKALECCIIGDCYGCFYGDTDQRPCRDDLDKNALDLINRQKAEIARLTDKAERATNAYFIKVEQRRNAKAEAVKEFAYRLKSIPNIVVHKREIDELVKEMVGDDDG